MILADIREAFQRGFGMQDVHELQREAKHGRDTTNENVGVRQS